jgi:dTDP-glucose pyrophosphorylase
MTEQELTVRPDDTIRAAYERIRANGRGIVVVVGDRDQVCGTVSDGAIRRAVLAGIGIDDVVERIMSRQPLTLTARRATKKDVREMLSAHRTRSMPVVAENRLVGMRSLDDVDASVVRAPVGVVMVGGQGERLRPLTDKVPKPLLRIGGLSIVERMIESLAKAGVEEVYLALNYKAGMFEERLGSGAHLGVVLHYVRERQAMGTAGALSLLPPNLEGPIVVANGDLVTTLDFRALLDFHWHHEGSITVTGVEYRSPIPYGVLRYVEHHLLAIEEKPARVDFVNAGIYVVEPTVLRFVPRGAPSGMPDLIARAVEEGIPVHAFPILERWFDIGSPEEFERVLLHFAVGADDEDS